MNSPAIAHPSREELKAFGLGKLEPAISDTILRHLETCEDCRRSVAESSGDSFLGRLREARKPDGTAIPDKPVSGLSRSLNSPTFAMGSPAGSLPPELENNPDYQNIEELGRGGMGVVYKAHSTLMGRDEVLKVMGKEIMSRPGAIDRFRREIQSAARLYHPNIVQAYSARLLGELLVFSMEFVPGDELGMLVKSRGPLPVANACYYVQQVAKGLQHAHEKRMVHRDIKPANLILHVDREKKKHTVKILDFGLAKVTSEAGFDGNLTGEGRMLGTPDFIAPEQILDAQSADIRADIYSLGCTLYFLLVGHPPFQANSLYELLRQHREVDAQPLNFVCPQVPMELAGVVGKMMAKDPARRFQTPGELAKVLAPFVKPGAVPFKPQREVSRAGVETAIPPSKAIEVGWTPAVPAHASPTALPRVASPVANDWGTVVTDSTAEGPVAKKPAGRRKGRSERPRWVWPVGLAGVLVMLLVVLWAGGVFRLNTKYGTIVLENFPPDADVTIDGRKITVKSDDGKEFEITIADDKKHHLEIKKDGFKVFSREIEVDMGGRNAVTVQLEPNPNKVPVAGKDPKETAKTDTEVVSSPASSNEHLVSLLNGKDLTGWKKEGKGKWKVDADGSLFGEGPDAAIVTTCNDFKDFILRAELSASADVEAFVLLRQRLFTDGSMQGMSTRVFGGGSSVWAGHADLAFVKNERGAKRLEFKPGESFTLEARVAGDVIWIHTNGQLTAGCGCRPVPLFGGIGLFVMKGTLHVTKLEIQGTPLTKPTPITSTSGIGLRWIHSRGTFEKNQDGEWFETWNGTVTYHFYEIDRGPEYTLLFDPKRDCLVWLYSNRATVQIGDRPPAETYRGGWEKRT